MNSAFWLALFGAVIGGTFTLLATIVQQRFSHRLELEREAREDQRRKRAGLVERARVAAETCDALFTEIYEAGRELPDEAANAGGLYTITTDRLRRVWTESLFLSGDLRLRLEEASLVAHYARDLPSHHYGATLGAAIYTTHREVHRCVAEWLQTGRVPPPTPEMCDLILAAERTKADQDEDYYAYEGQDYYIARQEWRANNAEELAQLRGMQREP